MSKDYKFGKFEDGSVLPKENEPWRGVLDLMSLGLGFWGCFSVVLRFANTIGSVEKE